MVDITDMVHGDAEGRAVERWKSGLSVAAISRALESEDTRLAFCELVTLHGGIAPARRRRAFGSAKA